LSAATVAGPTEMVRVPRAVFGDDVCNRRPVTDPRRSDRDRARLEVNGRPSEPDGSNNPLRQLASIRQTMTNTWQGVTSAGATSEWKSEGSEVADGAPTVEGPSIPVFFGVAFVPYSFEVGMDAVNFLEELTGVLVDSADNLQATAYTTGNGTNALQGIVTGLAGTSSEINTTGSEAIVASDAYALQNPLPARFSANATWQSHIDIGNMFRQFETSNGALAFPELREAPPRLIGKRWYENSNMDGSINAAATANNYVLIYGDVGRGFFIVDRVGSTLELMPNLVGSNRRPTGQRGALLWSALAPRSSSPRLSGCSTSRRPPEPRIRSSS
jgi:HK97 family phage major capsid protein